MPGMFNPCRPCCQKTVEGCCTCTKMQSTVHMTVNTSIIPTDPHYSGFYQNCTFTYGVVPYYVVLLGYPVGTDPDSITNVWMSQPLVPNGSTVAADANGSFRLWMKCVGNTLVIKRVWYQDEEYLDGTQLRPTYTFDSLNEFNSCEGHFEMNVGTEKVTGVTTSNLDYIALTVSSTAELVNCCYDDSVRIPDCDCHNIPDVLTLVANQTVLELPPTTLKIVPRPADLDFYSLPSQGYFGTSVYTSGDQNHKYRYYFSCSGSTFTLYLLLVPTSPTGYPGTLGQVDWVIDNVHNDCTYTAFGLLAPTDYPLNSITMSGYSPSDLKQTIMNKTCCQPCNMLRGNLHMSWDNQYQAAQFTLLDGRVTTSTTIAPSCTHTETISVPVNVTSGVAALHYVAGSSSGWVSNWELVMTIKHLNEDSACFLTPASSGFYYEYYWHRFVVTCPSNVELPYGTPIQVAEYTMWTLCFGLVPYTDPADRCATAEATLAYIIANHYDTAVAPSNIAKTTRNYVINMDDFTCDPLLIESNTSLVPTWNHSLPPLALTADITS